METWAKSDSFGRGELTTRQFQLGPDMAGVGTCKPILHGSVRVGFKGDEQAPENFSATIILPDDGGRIGPLDLPFEITLELPCLVQVRPDVAPSGDRDVIATASSPPLKLRWAATRRILLPHATLVIPGAPRPIPQWVHSLSCCVVDAAVTLFDAAGNVVCAATGPFVDLPRPRLAVQLATTYVDEDVPILFSYQA